jgi:hypothetical protein
MFAQALIVALASLAQAGDNAPDWPRFVARKGGFAIRLPGKPAEKDELAVGDTAKVKFHSLTWSDGDVVLGVYYHDNPTPIPETRQQEYLDRMAKGYPPSHGGIPEKEEAIKYKGKYPGRALEFDAPRPRKTPLMYRARLYLVGDRLYQVMSVRPQEYPSTDRIDFFLESFELLDAKADPMRAGPEGESEWKPFTPPGGRFTIAMPGDPAETRPEGEDARGVPPSVVYGAATTAINYIVTVVDYAPAAARSPKRLIDATRDGAVRLAGGKLLKSKAIRLGKATGVEFEAEVPLDGKPKGGRMRCRVYVAGGRVYQLVASGPKDDIGLDEVQTFFDSFALNPR